MYKIYILAFGGFFLLRNILTPMAQDDYCYSFIWEGDKGGNFFIPSENTTFHRERVQSLGDIFESLYSHYFTWGGRVVAHFFVQFFLWIGKFYFDIANTLVLIFLIVVIFKLADVSLKENPTAVAFAFTCILFLSQETSVTLLLLTGVCNYLWMSLLQLTFLIPYVVAIRTGKNTDSALKILAMAILGLMAGWSNESGSLAVVFLTAILVFLAKQKKSLSKFMIVGFLAAVTGCAFDILAPGNFAQMHYIQSVNDIFKYTPEMFKTHFLTGFLPILAIDFIVLLPMIYYFYKREKSKLSKDEILALAFVAAALLVPCAMMFSPKFDLRISLISMAFALVPSVWAVSKIKINIPYCAIAKKFVAVILICYSATLIYTDYSIYRATNENLAYILQHKEDDPVNLKPMNFSRKFESIQSGKILAPWVTYFGGIMENPNFYMNIAISQYYGLKSIVAKNN